MAKFYVQCAARCVVVDAADAAAAAMHLIDIALQPHLWIYDDAGLGDRERHDHLMLESLLHLAPEIRVSEQGFDRLDAVCVGTPETVQAWHHTMVSLSKMLVAAGLVPRPMRQLMPAPASEAAPRRRAASGLSLRPIRKAR